MELAELARLINEAARTNCDLFEVEKVVRAQITDPEDAKSRAVVWALNYMLISTDEEENRTNYGAFGPMMEMGGRVFPPYLSDIESETLDIWEQLSPLLEVSAASARVHDLLWVRRHGGEPHQHARQAIAGYLATAQTEGCEGLDVRTMLDRAFELSRQIGANDLLASPIARAVEVVGAELDRDGASSRPGIYVPLLRILANLPESDRPTELGQLLQRAHDLHQHSDPFSRESLFQLSEILESDPERRGQIRRQKVQMWLDWALAQDGLLRMIELSKALELANNTPEAHDLRDEIRRHLQAIDESTLDMKTATAEIPIPTEEAEDLIGRVLGNDDLNGALLRFGVWGPPTGDPDETLRTVEEQMRSFPMQFMVSQVITHAGGYPIKILDTDEEKQTHAQVRQEVLAASIHAVLAGEALDRIGTRFNPTREELRVLLQTAWINGDQADAFARAFQHYWSGNFDEAVHIALPRIEAVLRGFVARLGGVIYQEPRGAQPGGVRMLGNILQQLKPYFDPGWWRFLWVALAEPLGLNLRNEHLHGLAESASKSDAVLVLKVVAHIRLLDVGSAPAPTRTPTQS